MELTIKLGVQIISADRTAPGSTRRVLLFCLTLYKLGLSENPILSRVNANEYILHNDKSIVYLSDVEDGLKIKSRRPNVE